MKETRRKWHGTGNEREDQDRRAIHAIRVSAYENGHLKVGKASGEKEGYQWIYLLVLGSYSPECLIKMLASFSFKRTRHRVLAFPPLFQGSSWFLSLPLPLFSHLFLFNFAHRLGGSTKWEMKQGKRQKERWQIRQASSSRQVSRGPPILNGANQMTDKRPRVESSGSLAEITHSMNNQASQNIQLTSSYLRPERWLAGRLVKPPDWQNGPLAPW